MFRLLLVTLTSHFCFVLVQCQVYLAGTCVCELYIIGVEGRMCNVFYKPSENINTEVFRILFALMPCLWHF